MPRVIRYLVMAPLYIVLLALLLSASTVAGQQSEFSVVENGGVGQTVGQVANGGADFRFDGPTSTSCNMYFGITDGTLTTKVNIDREQIEDTTNSDVLGCVVAYTEDSSPMTKSILIHILDENDNEPRFFELNQPEIRKISENLDVPTPILRLEPVDKDKGENGTTTFEITRGNDQNYFRIDRALGDREDSTTRILNLVSTINVQSAKLFNLTVTISDMGEEPKVFDQVIVINITDLQVEPPTFAVTSVMYMVAENHPVGAENPFANITAANTDQVQGDIFYSLRELGNSDSSMIGVNEFTGELFLNDSLDFETSQQIIRFYIVAFNPSINSGDEVTVSITVVDVNDNYPSATSCFPCHHQNKVTLEEGNLDLTIVQLIFIIDADQSGVFKNISSDLNISVSDRDVGEINSVVTNIGFGSTISLTLDKPIDREISPNFTIQVTFHNEAEPYLSNFTTLFVDVLDINDNRPEFPQDSYTVRIAEGTPIGKEISTMQAVDGDAGENGTITYSIVTVNNPVANDWFGISPTSGVLTVASAGIDYNLVSGRVVLNVSATDHGHKPLVNFVEVIIEISPALTFSPNSYIAFNHFDLVASEQYSLYLELRTKRAEGVILFQQAVSGSVVSLELTEGHLNFYHDSSTTDSSSLKVSDDKWYSILIQKHTEVTLQVWETQASSDLVAETLMGATLFGCDLPESVMTSDALFIGGVNLFTLDDSVSLGSTEFVGTIRNVLINDTQVDLGCPTSQVNVLQGFHYSNVCDTEETAFCENDHTTGCVDYAPEPYCKCLGGFPPASCQPIQNPDPDIQGAHDSFAPIRFYGNTKADLQLDYPFFSDLEIQRRLADAQSTPNTHRRKRDEALTRNRTIQTIELTFKLVDVHSSVLLYSRTPTTIHRIQINEASEDTHAIVYMVNNVDSNAARIHIPVQWSLRNMTVYHVRVIISEDMALVSVEDDQEHSEKAGRWNDNAYAAFVEQPTSLISLGGAENGNGYLEGCISRLAIDSIEIPLSGLLAIPPEDGGFVAGSNETSPPTMYCELCDVTVCEGDTQCVREAMGEPICDCLSGLTLVDSECIPIVVTAPLVPPDPNLQYIIIGSVCAAILILIIVLVIVFIRVCHKKRDRQKRTYSVSNMNVDMVGTTAQTSKPNQYVHMQPRDNPMMTTLTTASATPRHDRGSSVSTFQEHAEDGDPEVETPRRLSRRKSTVSAESGIKTDTDQETSLRSIPRMEDSGNEKDTDYSDGESVSDDLSSTCFMQSPIGGHLIGSSNSITAIASGVSSPHTLTPKERQMITPLRPPSTALSATDFEDNHGRADQGTDLEDTFSYGHHTLPSSLSRNSSARRSGRRGSDSGDTSRVSSVCSGAHWYKASTASDNERERERSRANRAYYSQHSEPAKYPPEYLSPPTFEPKPDKSVPYPNTRRSRMPINIPESPSSASKNEKYQFPCDDSHVRAPRLRYDNHRLKHEYSLPKGHPSIALSSASSSSGRPRHNAEAMLASAYPQSPPHVVANYPRHYSTSGPGSSIPHHTTHYQYSRSYSTEDKPEQQQFKDLKSVSTINPISYWEMQDRMKTVVDQVDPYQILSEPYIQFEDVSTDPSVIESQITQDGPEHQSFCSQGGGERPADLLDPRLSLDNSTMASDTDIGPPIPIFPSADCSSQYTATLVASSSTSGASTPKTPNVFTIPSSQHHFDV